MNTEMLLDKHDEMASNARALMKAKNHDYAGKTGDTPFRNFELCEQLGLCSTEVGILVRMCDKMSRLANFAASGQLKVKGESVEDTCLDLMNYSVLLSAYLETKNE